MHNAVIVIEPPALVAVGDVRYELRVLALERVGLGLVVVFDGVRHREATAASLEVHMCSSRCWKLLLLLNRIGPVDNVALTFANEGRPLRLRLAVIHSFVILIHLGCRARHVCINLRGILCCLNLIILKSYLANQ